MILVTGAFLAHSQGLVSLEASVRGTVDTNNGVASGPATGTGQYEFELLDMTAAAWDGLTAGQQAGAQDLLNNPESVSLWSDSGISGDTGPAAVAGEVSGLGGASGTTAANWGAPTGNDYNTGSIDYYTVVGWSINLGASWSTLGSEISSGTIPISGSPEFFGQTPVAYNEAGGGPDSLPQVDVWDNSAQTALAGSGMPDGDVAGDLVLYSMPEPASLALVGLGSLSMLLFRRRKS